MRYTLVFLIVLLVVAGCGPREASFRAKAPRPVTTLALEKQRPTFSSQITGSVQSWKTEEIGFEVRGRLDWVLEPGKNIEGRVRDADGVVITPGTPLAKIDHVQYELAVESASAALEVAQRNLQVAEIRLRDTLPEEIKSAEADLELARSEYDRAKRLRKQNALSLSELDTAENQFQTSQARLASLRSSEKQAEAEKSAADARVRAAEQDLKNAERDLDNTTLFASFAGQVESVDVVPGSIVSPGSPIMRLQMMNPIKIEIEVSAEQSRQLQQTRQVGISFPLPDGEPREQRAMLYNVDPSADPATRTFTTTFLIINEQMRPALPDQLEGVPLARTEDLWPLNISEVVNGRPGDVMVEEGAIESEGAESWIWRVRDTNFGESLPELLKVTKEPVVPGDVRLPFLGNWVFRQVSFVDESVTAENLIVGKLEFLDHPREDWDGESVYMDSGMQWMLRPGDLVNVDLSPGLTDPGFYVPVEAIYEDRGSTYVFEVAGDKVVKTEVGVVLPKKLDSGSLLRIEPITEGALSEGAEIVVGGVHYLNDGDQVHVVGPAAAVGESR